jgi:hypothetical protein
MNGCTWKSSWISPRLSCTIHNYFAEIKRVPEWYKFLLTIFIKLLGIDPHRCLPHNLLIIFFQLFFYPLNIFHKSFLLLIHRPLLTQCVHVLECYCQTSGFNSLLRRLNTLLKMTGWLKLIRGAYNRERWGRRHFWRRGESSRGNNGLLKR